MKKSAEYRGMNVVLLTIAVTLDSGLSEVALLREVAIWCSLPGTYITPLVYHQNLLQWESLISNGILLIALNCLQLLRWGHLTPKSNHNSLEYFLCSY